MRIRSSKKRDSIITAAQQQFLQNSSYSDTSMDAIAAAAGVAKQTIYGYFATKEALFMAVVKKHIGEPWSPEDFPNSIEQITNSADLRALLELLLNTIASKLLYPEYASLARIILAESASQPKLANLYRQQIPEKGLATLTFILQTAVKKQIITVKPPIAARMIIGSVMTYFLLDAMFAHEPPKAPDKKQITAIIDEFMMYATKRKEI